MDLRPARRKTHADDAGSLCDRRGTELQHCEKVAGEKAVALIRPATGSNHRRYGLGLAAKLCCRSSACLLAFEQRVRFDEIIRIYIEDELGGRIPVLA